MLAHPLTRGLALDDPATTGLRRHIIRQKPFLRDIYLDWYSLIQKSLPHNEAPVLELGSGAGFLSDVLHNVITSEIFPCPNISMVADASRLPFREGSLGGIVMTDVLHHLPRTRFFFDEAVRCVIPGGAISMIEPWHTGWSRFIYTRLHHEPFEPDAADWSFPERGPLSGANGALPWIVFERDRKQFESEYPELEVQTIRPMMPFRYLVSGGVSSRSLMPGLATPLWRAFEASLDPWMEHLAMFALIVLRRSHHPKRKWRSVFSGSPAF